ncbi:MULTISPECIES: hypothetical protein [unclassified Cupriavidus]|uniref:hypothetical protein n=1 Tax=unclassified Cupriavidus TaxID=2640874 RepID=UPI001C0061F5|nr:MULTISPECIES: hypothetical protein [unclassified Cupriavidus]MCA3186063.1 hypothetical protein [Cupriavidus sp.]MCA3189672.1 hypothetical protein [Cupriavidus sp.]MCA3195690.1 hypothetical protein [Cupriavidus sp.]MCA3203847.1 hypothetical protein [Cupriavidus sp.]MCA3209444.1 hypothetical protein [Cupriavidus sp.]
MKVLLRAVLFFDALLDLLLGLLLLMSPFTTLYAALQLPVPEPALFGQLLGVATLGMSWLLFTATFNGHMTVPVARVAGLINLASAILVAAWTLFLDMPVQPAGKVWLLTLAAMLLFFAIVQLPSAKKVRLRERALAEQARADREARPAGVQYPTDVTDVTDVADSGVGRPARPATSPASPEYRREPVITPPPGYGPGTEVMTEPDPDALPTANHARQNPHS